MQILFPLEESSRGTFGWRAGSLALIAAGNIFLLIYISLLTFYSDAQCACDCVTSAQVWITVGWAGISAIRLSVMIIYGAHVQSLFIPNDNNNEAVNDNDIPIADVLAELPPRPPAAMQMRRLQRGLTAVELTLIREFVYVGERPEFKKTNQQPSPLILPPPVAEYTCYGDGTVILTVPLEDANKICCPTEKPPKPSDTSVNENNKDSCSICLAEFERGEFLKGLPCAHKFHTACIHLWLLQKNQCPNCRSRVSITFSVLSNMNLFCVF